MRTGIQSLPVVLGVLAILGFINVARGDLVAYYPLNGNVLDKSGNGHNGTIVGDANPHWASGVFGNSLELDGRNDFIDVPAFKMTSDSATFAAWIKGWMWNLWSEFYVDYCGIVLTDKGQTTGICLGDNDALHYEWDADSVRWQLGPKVPRNEWVMVAVTIGEDGATAYVYTPAAGLRKARNKTHHQGHAVEGLKIGWSDRPADAPAMFKGCIDEVTVFNHKLSDDEVEQLARLGGRSFVIDSPVSTWTKAVAEVEQILREHPPEKAVPLINNKVAEYEEWKKSNSNVEDFPYELISKDFQLVLAKAKESAGSAKNEVTADYVQAIYLSEKRLARRSALAWLLENVPSEEIDGIFREILDGSQNTRYTCCSIARQLERKGYWPTFELFTKAVIDRGQDVLIAMQGIDEGLAEHGEWRQKFAAYCKEKPNLTEYSPEVEFDLCKNLFDAGEYRAVIPKTEDFISRNRITHRKLVIKAMAMQAQSFARVGEIAKARRVFLLLSMEYPEAKEAPESIFLVGYGYMMQGQLNEAKEAFEALVATYPENSYSDKARNYIERIDNMIKAKLRDISNSAYQEGLP